MTTPISLESLDLAQLASVSGGCHSSPPLQQTQIVNMPQAPAPPAAPPMPMVQTSVSINGQPA
jgi:hypothetical protein